MITAEQVDQMFTYHKPTEGQPEKYTKIRDKAKELAHVILECTPPSPDQSVAIRKLRESVMTANAAIALDGKL